MALDGKYKLVTKSPQGIFEGSMTLKTDGTALSGNITTKSAAADFEGGTVNGNEFAYDIYRDSPIGKLKIVVKGTYDEASDSIKGSMKMKLGGARFTGTRIKE
jgi:hypothetical protein